MRTRFARVERRRSTLADRAAAAAMSSPSCRLEPRPARRGAATGRVSERLGRLFEEIIREHLRPEPPPSK